MIFVHSWECEAEHDEATIAIALPHGLEVAVLWGGAAPLCPPPPHTLRRRGLRRVVYSNNDELLRERGEPRQPVTGGTSLRASVAHFLPRSCQSFDERLRSLPTRVHVISGSDAASLGPPSPPEA